MHVHAVQSGRKVGRLARILGVALVLGVLAPLGVASFAPAAPAEASTYDATLIPLKFKQGSRVAVSPSGATGKNAGDIMKYTGVATINGTVIDAVVRTVTLNQATISKYDEGSAVGTPPPGSSQSVDDLLLTDIANNSGATEPSVTFEFSFYEGGTYTGVGSGVPVTLTNVVVNSYDIDSAGSAKQFTDFRGFQSYKTFTASSTQGLDVSDAGSGLVRFAAKSSTFNASATTGSYSFTRVQVNYDQANVLAVRMGALGASGAYFALDFSVGGIWTTDGTNPVTPVTTTNPYNQAPTTSDISTFYAAQGTGYVFTSSDFPYADAENNAFASLKLVTLPASGAGSLEYNNGSGWSPVTANQVVTVSDLDLGKLRLIPTSTGGSFTFQVNDGLAFSTSATLTFTAPAGSQTIDFPNPGNQPGATSHSFASGATASSGLTPTLTSLSTGVCTVSGLTITTLALPTGVTSATCVIVATQDGDASYGRAQSVTQQFAVSTLLGQTITFTNPGDRAFSTSPIVTDAQTSAPGLTVTLASQTPGICTVSGTTITPVTPGLCSVRATQAGNGTYSAASPVTRSFTLQKAAQAITFAQPGTGSLTSGPLVVSPTTDATGLTPTLASSTTSVCTVSGLTITYVAAGLCTVTASQSGNSTYAAATDVSRSFHIFAVSTSALPAGQVGTAYTTTLQVDGAAGGGTWSSGTLPPGLSLAPSTGVISGTPTADGSTTVTVTYTEGGVSHSVSLSLAIAAAAAPTPQNITFAQPATRALSAGALTVAPVTDAAGLTVALASSTTAVCTVSGFTVTFLSTGVCTLTASQAGGSGYAAAADVTRSLHVIAVTTASLASGVAGTPYTQAQTVAGAAGGGTWSTSSALPAGITLDPATGTLSGTPSASFDGSIVLVYTEGGAAASKALSLHVGLPATVPAPSSGTPSGQSSGRSFGSPAPAAPAATAARPSATPTPKPTAKPSTSAARSSQNTMDLGGDPTVAAGAGGLGGVNADQLAKARRSLGELQGEKFAGYLPGSGVQVDVTGAKTVATLAIAADGSIDATAIAKAVREATGQRTGDFVTLNAVSSVDRSSLGAPVTGTIPADDLEYFTLSGFDSPSLLSSMGTDRATAWVHFSVRVEGYKPGSTVYLAMTSSPIVFGTALVGKDGTAEVSGDMALDVLPAGVHRLRVVGDRYIGAVTADADGSIVLTADQMATIQKFDLGTDAAVRLSGENSLGGSHLAVRIVPLEQPVPWWMFWVLVGLGLALAISRLARLGESFVGRWVKRGILVLAGAVPIVVGVFIDTLPLTIASAIALGVGLLLSFVLPVVRQDPADGWDIDASWRDGPTAWGDDAPRETPVDFARFDRP
jgi:hypothetical protein